MSDDDEIETKIMGVPVKARGINTIGMVIMACALGACMLLLYKGNISNTEQLTVIQATLVVRAQEHQEMMVVLRSMMENKITTGQAITEQNYIILADQAERDRIKKAISMPQSLRDKLNR